MPNDPDFIRYICGQIYDAEWLTELIRRTEQELPMPKPRK